MQSLSSRMCCAASKPPLGSNRATPRMQQLTARSLSTGLLGSGRPSSAPQGSGRSSPGGPFTPATPHLERTVSAASMLAQSVEAPSTPMLGPTQESTQLQASWRGKSSKAPASPFAANIVADSRVDQKDTLMLSTACATVPERSDEADPDSPSEQETADDAQSKPAGMRAPQPALHKPAVLPLRLGRAASVKPDSEEGSSGSEADSDSETSAVNTRARTAGDASSALTGQTSGIELTGDADEDVRRMLALEGYDGFSSSSSSYAGR